jgi:chitodextrinase
MKKNLISFSVIFLVLLPLNIITCATEESNIHIVKGTLYVNDIAAPEGYLVKLDFDDSIKSGYTFDNPGNNFNYNIGFILNSDKIATIKINYKDINFRPIYNESISLKYGIEILYVDLHIYIDLDIDPPSKVTGLNVSNASNGKLNLIWHKAKDNVKIDHYKVYRDENFLVEVNKTEFLDYDLINYQTYLYQVSAVDTSGNEGALSDNVTGVPISISDNKENENDNDEEDDEKTDETEEYIKPKSRILGSYSGYNIKETINFKASVEGGLPPYQWNWDFGDTEVSNIQNPSHKYTKKGDYTIKLTVIDSKNFFDTSTSKIFIDEPDSEKNNQSKNSSNEFDIIKTVINFFGGIGSVFSNEGEVARFLPIVLLGILVIIFETFLVLFIRKKGFFRNKID